MLLQGESAIIGSYFGGTNIIYAVRGAEVSTDAYQKWYPQFAGTRIIHVKSPAELLATVKREFLTEAAVREAQRVAGLPETRGSTARALKSHKWQRKGEGRGLHAPSSAMHVPQEGLIGGRDRLHQKIEV